jgi:hypothetical protein
VSAVRLSGLDRNVSAIVIDMEAVSLVIPWCTWYKNPCFALHKKRTQHGQLRSIAVCCGQPKTPITLQQFAKTQVGTCAFFCQGDAQFGLQAPEPHAGGE